jgi:hypothetical protein
MRSNRMNLRETVGNYGLNARGSGERPAGAGSNEHGNEPPGFMKGREFPHWVRDYY